MGRNYDGKSDSLSELEPIHSLLIIMPEMVAILPTNLKKTPVFVIHDDPFLLASIHVYRVPTR